MNSVLETRLFDGFCPHEWEEDLKGLRQGFSGCQAKRSSRQKANLETRASRVRAGPAAPAQPLDSWSAPWQTHSITKVPATRTHHFPPHPPPSRVRTLLCHLHCSYGTAPWGSGPQAQSMAQALHASPGLCFKCGVLLPPLM